MVLPVRRLAPAGRTEFASCTERPPRPPERRAARSSAGGAAPTPRPGASRRPRTEQRGGAPDADRPRGDVRPAPRPRDDDDLRQPGLDRAADAEGLPRRLLATCSACRSWWWWAWPTASPRPAAAPTHANLHTAPGVGNAVGGIFNAQANKSPLLITAGQQVRPQITMEANLTNREAVLGPAAVREVGPRTAARPGRAAGDRARDPPRHAAAARARRSCRSRWTTGTSRPTRTRSRSRWRAASQRARAARPGRARGPRRARCSEARQPGADRRAPTSTRAAAGTPRWRSPRSSACAVWATPAPGGGRLGFPEDHPNFLGILPPAIGPASRDARGPRPRAGRRLLGVPLLPLHPRPAAARGHARSCRSRATRRRPRGRRWARAIVGDVGLALERLLELLGTSERPAPAARASSPASRRRDRTDERLGGDGRARRGLAGGRHRGRRDALEHGRAAQPPAPVEARQLLLLRQRRARLRDRRHRRRPARPARAPGRVRARRGLGAVRDHGAVDGGRLPRAGHLPGAAQRGVHDPQVVRRARAGDAARPGLDLTGLDVAARRRGLRRALAGGVRRRGARPRRCARRSPCRTARAWSQVPVATGMWLE